MNKKFKPSTKSLETYKRAHSRYEHQRKCFSLHDVKDKKVTYELFWHKN